MTKPEGSFLNLTQGDQVTGGSFQTWFNGTKSGGLSRPWFKGTKSGGLSRPWFNGTKSGGLSRPDSMEPSQGVFPDPDSRGPSQGVFPDPDSRGPSPEGPTRQTINVAKLRKFSSSPYLPCLKFAAADGFVLLIWMKCKQWHHQKSAKDNKLVFIK